MSFSLQYGMNTKSLNAGNFGTLQSAFESVAQELGGNAQRAVTFRSGATDIAGDTAPSEGTAYTVAIKLGDKA